MTMSLQVTVTDYPYVLNFLDEYQSKASSDSHTPLIQCNH
jgi:hypothetical protein